MAHGLPATGALLAQTGANKTQRPTTAEAAGYLPAAEETATGKKRETRLLVSFDFEAEGDLFIPNERARFDLYYNSARECFEYRRARGRSLTPLSLIRTAALYKTWGRCLSLDWEDAPFTGDGRMDRRIKARKRRKNRDKPVQIAARMLRGEVKRVHAHADPEALRVQKKAFSTLGRVPTWALTPESIRKRAKDIGWPDPEYAAKDFRRYRWFRFVLASVKNAERERCRNLVEKSGRVRKALARTPGGISGGTFQDAISDLDVTSEPPERRLTWIALAMCQEGARGRYGQLAEAIQRASDYEIRKGLKRAREIRAAQSETMSEEDFYIHSEEKAIGMLRWIADVQRSPDEDLHCSGRTALSNWAERSGRYHRDMEQDRRQQRSKQILQQNPYKTGLRPLDVPEGATALTTQDEIWEEGKAMSHCVGSYAESVISGRTLLFHYETTEGEGPGATIQMTKRRSGDWKVQQARGPNNRKNGATRKGTKVLNRWGAGEPTILPPRMQIGSAKVPEDRTSPREALVEEIDPPLGASGLTGSRKDEEDGEENPDNDDQQFPWEPQEEAGPDLPF